LRIGKGPGSFLLSAQKPLARRSGEQIVYRREYFLPLTRIKG
jgi:hypothetical protein